MKWTEVDEETRGLLRHRLTAGTNSPIANVDVARRVTEARSALIAYAFDGGDREAEVPRLSNTSSTRLQAWMQDNAGEKPLAWLGVLLAELDYRRCESVELRRAAKAVLPLLYLPLADGTMRMVCGECGARDERPHTDDCPVDTLAKLLEEE